MIGDSRSIGSNVGSISEHGVTWLNVERPTPAEADLIVRDYGIGGADLDQALNRNAATGSWRRDTYLVVGLQLPSGTSGQSRVGLTATPLTCFVGADFVATVHVGELRPLIRLMRECETDQVVRDEIFRDGIGGVVLAIIERLLDTFVAGRARVERAIGPQSDAMFEDQGRRTGHETVAMATRLRLDLRLMRRLAVPLVDAVQLLARETPHHEATALLWTRVQRRAEHLTQGLDDDLLALDGIVGAAEASATLETAREQRVLTAIAGLTLPVLAVAAVLSMPGGNPLTSGPNGYGYALGITGVVFLAALFILQRRGNL